MTAYYEHALSSVRWSSDGRRVVIGRRADPAASGESAIFVADLGAPGSVVVRADQLVTVPGGAAYQPVFSPLAGDDRIAFVQATGRKSCFRNDIFVTTSAGGSARPVGSTPNGACQLGNPDWSPDATWLVYDAWSGSLADQQAIYRVRADGSTKPILVVADRGAVYRLPRWRH